MAHLDHTNTCMLQHLTYATAHQFICLLPRPRTNPVPRAAHHRPSKKVQSISPGGSRHSFVQKAPHLSRPAARPPPGFRNQAAGHQLPRRGWPPPILFLFQPLRQRQDRARLEQEADELLVLNQRLGPARDCPDQAQAATTTTAAVCAAADSGPLLHGGRGTGGGQPTATHYAEAPHLALDAAGHRRHRRGPAAPRRRSCHRRGW